ncbi:MAG: hypothetical protein Kow00128_20900 [Deltaproteobacteria bacterium]
MGWLIPATVASSIGTSVLAAVYFYLWSRFRERHLWIWGTSWGIGTLVFLSAAAGALHPSWPAPMAAYHLTHFTSTMFLLWGTYVFAGKTMPRAWIFGLALGVVWILYGVFAGLSFLAATLPVYLFLGAVYIQTGLVFLRMEGGKGLGKKLTAWSFLLWGIHKMDFPFLRPVEWFAPIGFLLGALFAFAGALGILLVFFDRTREQLSLQEQRLRQAQKMEAVGRLAGGIAHDFNNLLTVINGYADRLVSRANGDEALRREANEIRTAGARAATLTRQLLSFSRRQVVAPRVFDPNALIEDLSSMLRRLIGERIELATDLAPDLLRMKADPAQVEQVLVNLVVNARDAMPDGGRITIATANRNGTEGNDGWRVEPANGPQVEIAVSDTGCGMDAETLTHLFEPFFTTKEVGRGTGLGLAIVHGAVRQMGGTVEVWSEPGRGASFRLFFPATEAPAEAEAESGLPGEAAGAKGTVLVVEDEEPVRTLICDVLRREGYDLLEAADGEEALRVVSRYDGSISLVVTDLVMPGMNGRDLGKALRSGHPGIAVLYTSGYPGEPFLTEGALEEGSRYLQKPFSPEALSRAVGEMLGPRPAGAGTVRQPVRR